jgi:hypothetical protein
MRSSKPSDGAPPAAGIDFDPEGLLGQAPGVLFDPRFTGSLHVDLEGQFGRDEAARTLVQMGCLRGLRDAAAVVEVGLADGAPTGVIPVAAELAIRLVWNPRPRRRGAVELHGAWPEQAEAIARLERLGPGPGPSCWLSAGYTSGWLSGLLGIDVVAFETSCGAHGDAECTFLGREVEAWRAEGPEAARALVAALPFPALRDLAGRAGPALEAPRGIDPSQPVVHIWGPVMVIPFAGADEAQLAVELIGRDPGAAGVSVVVIDLTGAIIDEAFGAAALERILERIESWGAEAVFAGISPLSEPAVAGLERQPLMLAKDLHGGIAAGFQIASAQRRMV